MARDGVEGQGFEGRGTISFWTIAAVAVVLLGIGIFLLVKGNPSGSTSQLDVSMRRPQASGPSLPDGGEVPGIEVRRPTLVDVYLSLIGERTTPVDLEEVSR